MIMRIRLWRDPIWYIVRTDIVRENAQSGLREFGDEKPVEW
jgi:hypothetical protein